MSSVLCLISMLLNVDLSVIFVCIVDMLMLMFVLVSDGVVWIR